MRSPMRVCFVCSGNICRSPTAEFAFARQARDAGLADLVAIDSAGTGAWHVGEDMDERARRAMVHAGYDVPTHAAKQLQAADLDDLDVVVALDRGHHNAVWWLAADTADVDGNRAKLVLLRAFDPQLAQGEQPEVADPYYGGPAGFTDVLAQIERSCTVLLEAVRVARDTGGPLIVPSVGEPAD